jgi:hypothetical protein
LNSEFDWFRRSELIGDSEAKDAKIMSPQRNEFQQDKDIAYLFPLELYPNLSASLALTQGGGGIKINASL